jgi:ribosomal protein L11 methyltransferase
VPYRIDLPHTSGRAFDTLVDLGALDVEADEHGLAALLPDSVSPPAVAERLGVCDIRDIRVSPAMGRDDGSVWTLKPRIVRAGGFVIVPAGAAAPSDAAHRTLLLADRRAFGTGLHPTTAMCLEAIDGFLGASRGDAVRVLDVGTGTGILALAALRRGAERAVGVDVDDAAVAAAVENARLNGLADRFHAVRGDADAVRGSWPLVAANILAADLMEMAPALVRRIASRGVLILSGIPHAVAGEVSRSYTRFGMAQTASLERGGWTALVFTASW